MDKKIYIIAETAFSHEGDKTYLLKQIDAACAGGADAVKFQVFINPTESYSAEINRTAGMCKWIYDEGTWLSIFEYVKSKNMDVIVLPVDEKALDFCILHNTMFDMIEVHSINFNHKFMLQKLNGLAEKKIILGIGGRTLADIEYALELLETPYHEDRIVFMHGFQSFPTKSENVRMARIGAYKDMFGVEMGYADHTSYDEDDLSLLTVAYLQGAKYIEKHLVLERGKERTDYQAAVDSKHLKRIREHLNWIQEILGPSKSVGFTDAEKVYRAREKKIVARRNIAEGEVYTLDNIGYMVVEGSKVVEQREIDLVLGKKARKNILPESTELL